MNSLLAESHRDRISVVLVSPRNPLNIGAAARAMANFGFTRLAVVAPFEAHWREAKSAVGASDLLQNAKNAESLADAVADCTLVVGTGSLEHRKPEQPVIPLPDLTPHIQKGLARGGRIALVFGSEKRGLTREDLALCHVLTAIPTDPAQPSMNLGQAVAVCLYEIASRIALPAGELGAPGPSLSGTGEDAPGAPEPALSLSKGASHLGTWDSDVGKSGSLAPAAARDLDLLAGVVEETMLAANYSPAAMRKANRHDLNLLLRRLALTRNDGRRILGIFRRVLWTLKHYPTRTARHKPNVTGK